MLLLYFLCSAIIFSLMAFFFSFAPLVLNLQFPIGIDSERFIAALKVPKVREHIEELKDRFAGRKVGLLDSLFF